MKTKLLSLEKLTSTKWLNLFRSHTRNVKGKTVEWFFASRSKDPLKDVNTSCAVLIVPIYKSDQRNLLVMTKEYRYPLRDYMYGLPAGLIETGDTLEHTIEKEIKEETGLEVKEILDISKPVYTSPGFSDECINIAIVEVTGEISEDYQDDHEDIKVLLCDIEDVEDILRNTSKLDAKVWTILYHFLLKNKISFSKDLVDI
tara:strand:- start:709 stop:1311 length:603 start_codon:yes stop_codon:yes gene_type:complete